MRQLAERPPSTKEDLSRVEGVGAVALERHADRLLELLGNRQPIAPPATAVPMAASNNEGDTPSWQVSVNLFQNGHTLLAIAERRMLSPSTIVSHLVSAKRDGVEVDLRPALPPTEQIQLVRKTLSEDPDASVARLQEQIDYRLSRAELRLVLAHLRPSE